MKAMFLRLMSIAAFCILFSLRAGAAETYIFSDVVFDDETGIVSAVGRTEPDYSTLYWYYQVWAGAGLTDVTTGASLGGTTVSAYNTPAEVHLQVEGEADHEYEVGSGHYIASSYYVYNYYSQGQYYSGYRDYFNYGQYEGQNPIIYGGFTFTAFGPEIIRYSSNRFLGQTKKKVKIGTPHHLKILDDTFSRNTGCEDKLVRRITFKVVDVNNKGVGKVVSKRESDSSAVDSCSNTTPSYASSCTTSADATGTFTDNLQAGCYFKVEFGNQIILGQQPPCGFYIPDEQWLWCSPNGDVPLALLDYYVHHETIVVSGYNETDRLPINWYVRPDGSLSAQ